MREAAKSEGADRRAIGFGLLARVCGPGADAGAVWWRCSLLMMGLQNGEFSQFKHRDDIDDALIGLFARFPFRAVKIQRDGTFQMNADEFQEELKKLPGAAS
jgi:hypothetical protein